MRLSELMMEGAMVTPYATHTLYNPATGGTCALGAIGAGMLAMKGMAITYDSVRGELVESGRWFCESLSAPFAFVNCPVCAMKSGLAVIIAHLNNQDSVSHGWDRLKIAEWLMSHPLLDEDVPIPVLAGKQPEQEVAVMA